MAHIITETELKHHLIIKYRELISKRYEFENISKHPDVPDDITPEIVAALKNYFLVNVYPEPELRDKLDAAFHELENYVHQPAKVWGLLGNLAGAIFRFGRQFPAALRAGLVSLEAHTSAKRFESDLLKCAIDSGYQVPMTDQQFLECIKAIPYHHMDRFIHELGNLFNSFTNTSLMEKTILIMHDVLKQMKKKNHLYGPNEVQAIVLGIDILQKGHDLFQNYDEQLKKDMVKFIISNERYFVKQVYGMN